MKRLPFILLILALLAAISFFVYRNAKASQTPEVPSISDLNGKVFDPTSLKNKVYIVSYFQTWCGDCIKEQPELQKLKDHFGDKLEILMVSDEAVEKLSGFKTHFNTSLNIYHSDKSLKADLGVRAYPTTCLFGPDGKLLLKKVEGIAWYNDEVISIINNSLN